VTVAFVGDIHGDVKRLKAVLGKLPADIEQVVFLGDYVNRGGRSAEVIEALVGLSEEQPGRYRFLEGHHDAALRRALDDDELIDFLRMGGADTINDYLAEVPDDVLAALQNAVPEAHRSFLRRLEATAEGEGWIAAHEWLEHPADLFGIFGHSVQGSMTPSLTETDALIDTGCGTLDGGPLTAYFYPSGEWIQS